MNILVSAAGRRVRRLQLFREAVARLGLSSKVDACDGSPMSAALFAGFRRPLPRHVDPSPADDVRNEE